MDQSENLKLINKYFFVSQFLFQQKKYYARNIFDLVYSNLNNKNITILEGLKGAGKTTLCYQLIEKLSLTTSPENFVFIPLDLISDPISIHDALTELFPFSNNSKVFIFLNRCQNNFKILNEIEKILLQKKNFFFILTSDYEIPYEIFVNLDSKGLVSRFRINPLSFREKLNFCKIKYSDISFFDLLDFEKLLKNKKTLIKNDGEIQSIVDTSYSSLPDLFSEKSKLNVLLNLKGNISDKIIYKTINSLFEVRNLSSLISVFEKLCDQSSEIINLLDTSKECKVSYPSLLTYIKYFQDSFLISEFGNYYFDSIKQKKTNKKIFVSDPGFLLFASEILKIKTMIFNHVQNFSTKNDLTMYYWNHDRTTIDLIIDTKEMLIPVDIKYDIDPAPDQIKNMIKFLKKNKMERGIILTKDKFDLLKSEKTEIMFLPVYLFLIAE